MSVFPAICPVTAATASAPSVPCATAVGSSATISSSAFTHGSTALATNDPNHTASVRELTAVQGRHGPSLSRSVLREIEQAQLTTRASWLLGGPFRPADTGGPEPSASL